MDNGPMPTLWEAEGSLSTSPLTLPWNGVTSTGAWGVGCLAPLLRPHHISVNRSQPCIPVPSPAQPPGPDPLRPDKAPALGPGKCSVAQALGSQTTHKGVPASLRDSPT